MGHYPVEAGALLREAVAIKEDASEAEEPVAGLPRNALERMQASLKFVGRQWER